jgi:hypothetical protein
LLCFGAERQAQAAVPPLAFQQEFFPTADFNVTGYSYYGQSVGLDTNVAIVGAPALHGNQVGVAYAYVRGSNGWEFSQQLSGSGQVEQFGRSVAASGNTVLIGGPAFEVVPFSGFPTGVVYFFVLSQGVWSLQQQVIGPQDGQAHFFGGQVALDGDTALIGDPFFTSPVYVYVRSASTWSLQQTLSAADSTTAFGQAGVALSGDTALVSDFGQANQQGAVYVFVRSGGVWQLQQEIPSPDPAPADGGLGEEFGISVALSGDTAVVGDYVAGTHVFTRSAGVWSQQAVLASPGTSVAISEDASTILVGNTQNLFTSMVGAWGLSGSTWTKQRDLVAPDRGAGWFGQSLSIRGNTALIGSLHGAPPHTGQAYFFAPGVVVPAMGEKTMVVALLLLLGAGVVKAAARRRSPGARNP